MSFVSIRVKSAFLIPALLLLATAVLAAPAVAEDGEPMFIWPTNGRITQPYGCTGFRLEPRRGSCAHFHGGIDIANKRGTPIHAAADGVITHVGWDPWGTRNWMVMINHGDGFTTWYAHMRGKHIDGIRRGVRVKQGDLVGYMDTTGMSTGPHLHWAVLRNGSYVNPRKYVEGSPKRRHEPPASSVCDGIWIAALPGAATAVVLEGESTSRDSAQGCAG